MHLSIVCPTSPCTGIDEANTGFDQVVYFKPAPLGVPLKINPATLNVVIRGDKRGFGDLIMIHNIFSQVHKIKAQTCMYLTM